MSSRRHLFVFVCCGLAVLSHGCIYPSKETVPVGHTDVFKVPALELTEANEPNVIETESEILPEELSLTLEECRALALRNNLAIRATLMEPTLVAEQVSQEKAKFESVFQSSMSYRKSDDPSYSTLEGNKENYWYGQFGLDTPLQTGGKVSLGLTDTRSKSDSGYWTMNPNYGSGLSFSLSQPLLRNAGSYVNRHSIRIVQYQKNIAEARVRSEVTGLIRTVDGYYWGLYALRKELEVRKSQYDLAEAQLEQTRRLVEQGQVAQVEIIRAEAGLAERLEAIIIAQNNVQLQERGLKRVINKAGLGLESPNHLIPASEPAPVKYAFDTQHMVQVAVENRMELLELEIQLAQDRSVMDYYRSQSLPAVSLSYGYDHSGLGPSRREAYELLTSHQYGTEHSFGLNMEIPLGNQAAKHRLREAVYQKSQRLATQASRKLMIKEEVLNAIDEVEAGWQRILASRHNAVTAGRQYEAEKRQFELGLRTNTEVLDAQASLANAQSSEIRALADYQIALEDLAYYTGTLLGAAQVEWEPITPAS